jgi:hypothetical protein
LIVPVAVTIGKLALAKAGLIDADPGDGRVDKRGGGGAFTTPSYPVSGFRHATVAAATRAWRRRRARWRAGMETTPERFMQGANVRGSMPIIDSVTLIIYGWKSVQPGTLSWVFPSVAAAAHAAHAMTNAARWAVFAGNRPPRAEERAEVSLARMRAEAKLLLEGTSGDSSAG